MFDRHRIRRWRIGHEEQLAGFTRDDVCGLLPVALRARSAPSSPSSARGPRRGRWRSRARPTATGPPAAGAVDRSPEEPDAPRGPGPHAARGRHPGRAGAGLADGAAAASRRAPRSTSRRRSSAPAGAAGSTARCASPGIVTWVAAHNYAPTELGVFSVSGGARGPTGSGSGVERHRRGDRPGSRCSGPPAMSWSAPARCCRRAGRGGSSPWRVGRARSRRRRRWRMSACSTGSTPSLAEITAERGTGGGRASSAPDAVAGRCVPAGRRGARISPPTGWPATFAVTALRRGDRRRSPRVQRPAAVPRALGAEHGVKASPGCPGADLLV